jgi:hypothetical protein
MDLGAGAVFGAATIAVVVVLAVIYGMVRLRHGKPPPHAAEQAQAFDRPVGDEEIAREPSSGLPSAVSADEMRQRARGNGG